MQDILVTVIIAWILFRLFRPVIFVQWNKPQKHYHNYYPNPPKASSNEGEIKVTKQSLDKKSNNLDDSGEYIDFEELPNRKS